MLTRAPHFRFVDLSYFLFFPVSPSIKWCLKVNCALLSHAYHVVHPRFEAPVTSHRESSLDGKCSAAQSLAPIVASLQLPLRNSLAASIARTAALTAGRNIGHRFASSALPARCSSKNILKVNATFASSVLSTPCGSLAYVHL